MGDKSRNERVAAAAAVMVMVALRAEEAKVNVTH